jgi:hypothetical protein
MQHAARIFNDTFRYRWERIVDFLKLHYVLYGMGFRTETAPWLLSDSDRSRAREAMSETARHAKALGEALPANRDLLTRIQRYGLQKI